MTIRQVQAPTTPTAPLVATPIIGTQHQPSPESYALQGGQLSWAMTPGFTQGVPLFGARTTATFKNFIAEELPQLAAPYLVKVRLQQLALTHTQSPSQAQKHRIEGQIMKWGVAVNRAQEVVDTLEKKAPSLKSDKSIKRNADEIKSIHQALTQFYSLTIEVIEALFDGQQIWPEIEDKLDQMNSALESFVDDANMDPSNIFKEIFEDISATRLHHTSPLSTDQKCHVRQQLALTGHTLSPIEIAIQVYQSQKELGIEHPSLGSVFRTDEWPYITARRTVDVNLTAVRCVVENWAAIDHPREITTETITAALKKLGVSATAYTAVYRVLIQNPEVYGLEKPKHDAVVNQDPGQEETPALAEQSGTSDPAAVTKEEKPASAQGTTTPARKVAKRWEKTPTGSFLKSIVPDASDEACERVTLYLETPAALRQRAFTPTKEEIDEIKTRIAASAAANSDSNRDKSRQILWDLNTIYDGPTVTDIKNYLKSTLVLTHRAQEVFSRLSDSAIEGLYALVSTLSPSLHHHVVAFLENQTIQRVSSHENILNLTRQLYLYAVDGYDKAFIPFGIDRKFLENDEDRILSLEAEFMEALRIAKSVGPYRVAVAKKVSIAAEYITANERALLLQATSEAVVSESDVAHHALETELDIVFRDQDDKMRLVEVKRSRHHQLEPGEERTSKNIKQVTRHAIVARQSGWSGVEYVCVAEKVSEKFTAAIHDRLEALKMPHAVVVSADKGAHTQQHSEGFEGTTKVNFPDIQRPLPRLPEEHEESALTSNNTERVQQSKLSASSINFLNLVFHGNKTTVHISENTSFNDYIDITTNQIAGPYARFIIDNIRNRLKSSVIPESNKDRINTLMEECERGGKLQSQRHITATCAKKLLEIAKLATLEINLDETPEQKLIAKAEQISNILKISKRAFGKALYDIESSLSGLKALCSPDNCDFLNDGLAEYSIDEANPILGYSLREVWEVLPHHEIASSQYAEYIDQLRRICELYEEVQSYVALQILAA